MELAEALDSRRGRTAEVAKSLKIAPAYLSQMASGRRPVPPELAPALERELNGEVRLWNLRPKDWHRIWPDLIGSDGAPQPSDAAQGLQAPDAVGEQPGQGPSKFAQEGA
jgi:DNA-binding transcriptional regulator YdaS (Cro superfamily)